MSAKTFAIAFCSSTSLGKQITQAIGLTQRSATAAVGTLLRVMHDTKATWSSRVAAATQVLKFARESIELDDLSARVEGLERQHAERDTE